MRPVDILRIQCYTAVVHAVTAEPSKFIDNISCAICKEKHKFDECPILLDTVYLGKVFHCLLFTLEPYAEINQPSCQESYHFY